MAESKDGGFFVALGRWIRWLHRQREEERRKTAAFLGEWPPSWRDWRKT
jgi:hypothetical protein